MSTTTYTIIQYQRVRAGERYQLGAVHAKDCPGIARDSDAHDGGSWHCDAEDAEQAAATLVPEDSGWSTSDVQIHACCRSAR